MTDEEARTLLQTLMEPCPVVSLERRREALRHALRSIEDRATMVQHFVVGSDEEKEIWNVARQHMKGQD